MDHETAIRIEALERYTLGEMNDDEAAAFEEHFFDCRECAQDVRDAVAFKENAKAVYLAWKQEESRAGQAAEEPAAVGAGGAARSFQLPARSWLAVAAAVAVLAVAVVAYQNAVVIPRLERYGAPYAAAPTVLRVVRAEVPVVTVARDQPMFTLVVDVDVTEPAPRYRIDFVRSTGEPVTSLEAGAPEAGTLQVNLPASAFPPGAYAMVLRAMGADGTDGEEIERYRFRIEKEGA